MRYNSIKISTTFVLLSFNLLSLLFAQNFEGRITDNDKKPIIGSTVSIVTTSQGLSCNENGEFQTNLKPGNYDVEYRCMGYQTFKDKITIREDKKTRVDIVLNEKPIELAEIIVSNKEDPAYEIMRQAIKKAPYYLNVVRKYDADTYIKGNMELTKVSKITDKLAKTEEGMKMSDFKGKLFVQESYSNIKYIFPDEYEQTVNAFSSSIPDNLNPKDAMSVMRGSLYSPRFSGMVSPLNPKAFGYYRFRYEGFTDEEGLTVNKIRIIPKLKDPELMSGYLMIAENTWDIRYAELSSEAMGIKQNFTITYNQVAHEIYLPITYNNQMEANIMGVGGYFNYFASLKYNDILIDESKVDSIEKRKEKSLEIKWGNNRSVKTDSLATKRDLVFWAEIRNTPLNEKEEKSYLIKDSIQQHIDSVRSKFHNSKFKISDLLDGGKIGGDSTRFTFGYSGFFGALRDYNFVDGFGLGQKFFISTKLNETNKLSLTPEIYYTTARKNTIWKSDLQLTYSPMRLGELTISGGDISADYNPLGVNRLDNAINSLLWGKSAAMFYRKKYVSIKNEIDLANGLRLTTQMQIAKRSGLENNTDFSFFGSRNIKPNIDTPHNFDLSSYDIKLVYTPRYYYSIYKGKKQYRHSKYPSFMLSYSEGFSAWQSNNSRFRNIGGGISQSIKTSLFSNLNYAVTGGSFLGNKNRTHFADYKHFNTSDVFLTSKTPYSSFMLLDAYQASTNDYWIQTHINYYSKYILLKRLPFLQGKMFNESLHFKYLYSPNKKNYIETGYSVDLFRSLSLGVHCSFDKLKYESIGIRLSFNTKLFD